MGVYSGRASGNDHRLQHRLPEKIYLFTIDHFAERYCVVAVGIEVENREGPLRWQLPILSCAMRPPRKRAKRKMKTMTKRMMTMTIRPTMVIRNECSRDKK
jgi:hypothetical protein